MPVPDISIDLNDFVVVPDVYVLDEFDMTDDDGNVVARIDAEYIRKTVARMNERERTTGDLSPVVIGHTKDNPQGNAEVNGPPLIGYARNWKQLPFFNTGKTAAAPDILIHKDDVERAKKFPRRSSEVWVTKHEIDPISFLGATTPARDLGLLRLDANTKLTVLLPILGNIFERPTQLQRFARDCKGNCTLKLERTMPDVKADDATKAGNTKPDADPKESGGMKELMGKMDALTSVVQKLADAFAAGQGASGAQGAGAAGAAAGAQGAAGAGGDAPLSDDELEQMLSQASPDMDGAGAGASGAGATSADDEAEKKKSRKGEDVVKNTGYAGGDNTNVPNADVMKRLAANAEELGVLRIKLARSEVKERLQKAVDEEQAALDPKDEKLVSELVAMPEDMRENMIVRLARTKSISARSTTGHANDANRQAQKAGGKRITEDDRPAVIKLARQKGIDYSAAAAELGFTVG